MSLLSWIGAALILAAIALLVNAWLQKWVVTRGAVESSDCEPHVCMSAVMYADSDGTSHAGVLSTPSALADSVNIAYDPEEPSNHRQATFLEAHGSVMSLVAGIVGIMLLIVGSFAKRSNVNRFR
jgi:hypothetical protein